VQQAAEELMGKGSISIEPAPVLSGTLGAALVAAASKNYMSGKRTQLSAQRAPLIACCSNGLLM